MDILRSIELSNKVSPNYTSLTFLSLFENQVSSRPQDIAAVYKGCELTYYELNKLSTNLAKLLRVKGLRQGDVIALAVFNSLDFLIGMLGILKAGGIYLPIDPHYPNKRISQMFLDAKPFGIITEVSLEERFSKWNNSLFLIDMLPDIELDVDLESINSEEIAYIVYTSGSSGSPKGIYVSHSSLTHAVVAYQSLHPNKYSTLLTGSISFDPSILISTFTLSLGGTVFIPQNNYGIDPKGPEESVNIINNHSVEYLLCTPSFYSKILKTPGSVQSLKCVDLCGENIPANLLSHHANVMKDCDLFNVYGPSEYAMGATAAKLYDAESRKAKEITIGKPFFNNEIYILDEYFQPVRLGEKGEIYIAGAGLAQGYLNKDQLTENKFLSLRLGGKSEVRLYRTGDMGKRLKNGDIKFLGREDQQVKVLGHRIELNEIEQAICTYPNVYEAVVLLIRNSLNNGKLIAYIRSRGKKLDATDIKKYLTTVLPSFMIPKNIIMIKKWPYNDNGKIDRNKLLPKSSFLKEDKNLCNRR